MRNTIIAAALAVGIATPALADNSPWEFGIGILKCSAWSRVTDDAVGHWVQGYWSGLNGMAYVNNMQTAGATFKDGNQIIYAVHAYCFGHPKMEISEASNYTYLESRARGE